MKTHLNEIVREDLDFCVYLFRDRDKLWDVKTVNDALGFREMR
jgi:hypothetical protein